jgi:hypothetical protein
MQETDAQNWKGRKTRCVPPISPQPDRQADAANKRMRQPSVELVQYGTARKALVEAKRVDEVLEINNRAAMMAVYARQSKDFDMESNCIAIRERAKRRLGELMRAQKETVGLNRGAAVPTRVDDKPTLASQGIDKNLAHQARSLSAMSEDAFEQHIEDVKTRTKERHLAPSIAPTDEPANEPEIIPPSFPDSKRALQTFKESVDQLAPQMALDDMQQARSTWTKRLLG